MLLKLIAKISRSSNPAAPVIPWSMIEANMFSDGDTLAILDSCFSSTAAMGAWNTEYLVASGVESPASAVIQRSFTRRLIELLQSQINPVMTLTQIHAKVVNQAYQPGSSLDNTPVHMLLKTSHRSLFKTCHGRKRRLSLPSESGKRGRLAPYLRTWPPSKIEAVFENRLDSLLGDNADSCL
jgi:hypothetical protein